MTDPNPAPAARQGGGAEPTAADDGLGPLAEAVERLAAALRRLDVARLGRPPRRAAGEGGAPTTGTGTGPSVADLSYGLAGRLAELQRSAGDRPPDDAGPGEGPPGPALPRLADHAAGDQLAVVGRDAVAALRALGAGRTEAVAGLAEQLKSLRLRL